MKTWLDRIFGREMDDGLAADYMIKANAFRDEADALRARGDNRGAVALCDQQIAIWERLVEECRRRKLDSVLAVTYLTKAVALLNLDDKRGAVALTDQAIVIYERLVNRERRSELADDLVACYKHQCLVVDSLGDHRRAAELGLKACDILERLARQKGGRTSSSATPPTPHP